MRPQRISSWWDNIVNGRHAEKGSNHFVLLEQQGKAMERLLLPLSPASGYFVLLFLVLVVTWALDTRKELHLSEKSNGVTRGRAEVLHRFQWIQQICVIVLNGNCF